MALSNTQEIVERSIYKKIEALVIAEGYTPDKSLFTNDPVGITAYREAVQAMVVLKGFAIATFGVGSSQKKDIKTIPRIVMIERKSLPGDLGGSPEPQYELDVDRFVGKVQPPQTDNYHFQINLVYSSAKEQRVLEAIIAGTLNNRGYVNSYINPEEKFFVRRYNSTIVEDNDRGIKEKIYLYEAMDIWLTNDTVLPSVAKINEIKVDITSNDKIEDTLTVE